MLIKYLLKLPPPLGRWLLPRLNYLNFMRGLEKRMFSEWVREVEGLRVLDVGCGQVMYFLYLAQEGAHMVGVDLELSPMAILRKVARYLGLESDFLVGDIAHTPLSDETFDLVICNCALEHVAEDNRGLWEMSRVLKPRGLLFLTVDCEERDLFLSFTDTLPRWCRLLLLKREIAENASIDKGLRRYLEEVYHIRRRYRRQELASRLEEIGFQILDYRYYLTGIGAFLYETMNSLRGLNVERGIGRAIYMLTSLLSYPSLALLGDVSQRKGHGLGLLARKRPLEVYE